MVSEPRQQGGAANHVQPPCRAGHPRPDRGQGPLQGGDRLQPGPTREGGQPAKGANYRATRKGLRPVASPAASRGHDTGHKGGCRRAGPAVACAGALATVAMMTQIGQGG
ncbi:hypothetical protein B296_00048596 [Ensete ventricosum]|uniref:Uncharacterized protein n=1 Tax=Ensete ventricosum TaxID=4639 RepID=A0A426X330_ENSVE|nr:hypothetical protein B296_00048596 [Ensete ventricosum]